MEILDSTSKRRSPRTFAVRDVRPGHDHLSRGLRVLRVALRRKSGAVAFTDLLVLVLIADAAQNAMAADYHSITAGLVLAGTLIFWA